MRPTGPTGTRARRPARRLVGETAAALVTLATVSSPALGVTRRVPLDFPTIHQALAASTTADSVLVAPGVWSATTTRSVSTSGGPVTYVAAGFLPHGVTLISESGAAATSIEVTASGANVRGLVTDPLAGAGTARVIGFTFRKPNATGAAIVAHGTPTSQLAVEGCRFENLAGATEAGGIHVTYGDLAVTYSTFDECSTTTRAAGIAHVGLPAAGDHSQITLTECDFLSCIGGGVLTQRADLRATDCLFQGGSTATDGCAIAGQASRVELDACQFLDNVALQGSVLSWNRIGCTGWFRGSLFARNRTAFGAAFLRGLSLEVSTCTFVTNEGATNEASAVTLVAGAFVLRNNIFADNTGSRAILKQATATLVETCNIYWNNAAGNGVFPNSTSRVTNPQFCDAAAGDYTLHSSSPGLAEHSLACGPIGAFGAGCGPASPLVMTNPSGLTVRVDGAVVPTPYAPNWVAGEQHELRVITPQSNGATRVWAFSAWSDGLTDSTRIVTVPAEPALWQVDYVDEALTTVIIRAAPLTDPVTARIDGVLYTLPQTRLWNRNSVHALIATAEVSPPTDGQWSFVSWSDGAPGIRSYTVPQAGGTIELVANYSLTPYPLCTVTSEPEGRTIKFLGVDRVTPYARGLKPGTSFPVSLTSPQITDLGGTVHTFLLWSDGGAQSHSFTMPTIPHVLTAAFQTVVHDGVLLQTLPPGLQIDLDGVPRTPPLFIPLPAGSEHSLHARSGQALAGTRYDFSSWNDGSTTAMRAFSQPSGHLPFAANFEQNLSGLAKVTLQTSPPGLDVVVDHERVPTPVMFTWPVGSAHLLEALFTISDGTSIHQYLGWSHFQPREHFFTVPLGDIALTASYRTEHTITMAVDPVGTVLPGTTMAVAGVPLEIRAIPDPKYYFLEWVAEGLGSYSGPDNPVTIFPQGPITEVARFGLVSYDLALSLSPETHTVHTGPPLGFGEVYLWFVCGTGQGFSILDTRATGTMEALGFAPEPGIFNLGSGTDARILVETCPTTPTLLGRFFVSDPGGGTLCLGPSAATGRFEVVDCAPGHEVRYPWPDDLRVTGVTTGFDPFCVSGRACGQEGGPVPVRLSSFEAVERDGGVDVTWKTSFEARHEGFRVYRSSDADSRPGALHEGLLDGESPYLFRDADIVPDMRYWYLLGAFDYGGAETRYGPIAITTSPARPLQFGFAAVHPNPFVERAVLQFTLAKPGRAHVDAFDVAGRLVGRVLDGVYPAGDHSAAWDGRDDRGRRLSAGIYFLRLKTDADSQTRRVVMLGTR